MSGNKDKCKIENPWKFLFWEGVSTSYIHDWVYTTKERRMCSKCGRAEILFARDREFGDDWRRGA